MPRAAPIPGNIEDLFPVWNDWTTWNLAALSPITRFYRKACGRHHLQPARHRGRLVPGQLDDHKDLILNLGLRYDVSHGSIGDRVGELLNRSAQENIKPDLLNFAPRLGFAYACPTRKPSSVVAGASTSPSRSTIRCTGPRCPSDRRAHDELRRRANFAADPYNGQVPTKGVHPRVGRASRPGRETSSYRTALSHACTAIRRRSGSSARSPRRWGSRPTTRTRQPPEVYSRNSNLSYDPATGVNYRLHRSQPSALSRTGVWCRRTTPTAGRTTTPCRPHSPSVSTTTGRRLVLTRFGQYKDANGAPDVGFAVAPDLGGEYSLAAADQRHRAVFNGIWQLRRGFQLSGLYFFGSGQRYRDQLRRRSARRRHCGRRPSAAGRHASCRATTSSASRSTGSISARSRRFA